MFLGSVYHVDVIAGILEFARAEGFTRVEPSQAAQDAWTVTQAVAAERLLRRQTNNYMVKVADDGSRVYIPFGGGLSTYVGHVAEEVESNFVGFEFTRAAKPRAGAGKSLDPAIRS
jgi:hypothetical protein